jgi:hypothetical protein
MFRSFKRSPSIRFSHQTTACISMLTHAYHMSCPSHNYRFTVPKSISEIWCTSMCSSILAFSYFPPVLIPYNVLSTLFSCILCLFFFIPMPSHVHIDFVVPPPGCGRSVTDFWGWGAHRAQLRCPDDVSSRRGLKTKFYRQPRPWSLWGFSLQGKNLTAEPGIEPETSWLVVTGSNVLPLIRETKFHTHKN